MPVSGRNSNRRPAKPRTNEDKKHRERPVKSGGPRKGNADNSNRSEKPYRSREDNRAEPPQGPRSGRSTGSSRPRPGTADNNAHSERGPAPRRWRDDADKPRTSRGRTTDNPDQREQRPAFKKFVRKEEAPGPERKPVGRNPGKKPGASRKSLSAIADGPMRLNKYIAHAGICSRREADVLIASGVISVNGKVITEMGYQVMPGDKVQMGDQTLRPEKLYYVALNKPKGYITTTDDPDERKTVMELVKDACRERIYPVGRLDRNTTGVLLFTNDGEMAKKLTHPRHGVRKIYHVFLNKNLSMGDLNKITEGVVLEDGLVKVDEIAYVAGANDKKQVGITLHSGKNRVVRRIFEHLGYEVVKLDRVSFAGITKKLIPRGKWKMLTQEEVNILKRLR